MRWRETQLNEVPSGWALRFLLNPKLYHYVYHLPQLQRRYHLDSPLIVATRLFQKSLLVSIRKLD